MPLGISQRAGEQLPQTPHFARTGVLAGCMEWVLIHMHGWEEGQAQARELLWVECDVVPDRLECLGGFWVEPGHTHFRLGV